jgi:hypothetical protein
MSDLAAWDSSTHTPPPNLDPNIVCSGHALNSFSPLEGKNVRHEKASKPL